MQHIKLETDKILFSIRRPENGVIEFDNYATRYREGLDLVLKGKVLQQKV